MSGSSSLVRVGHARRSAPSTAQVAARRRRAGRDASARPTAVSTVRTEVPGASRSPKPSERDEDDRRADGPEPGGERDADDGAEVAAGVAQGVDRSRRSTARRRARAADRPRRARRARRRGRPAAARPGLVLGAAPAAAAPPTATQRERHEERTVAEQRGDAAPSARPERTGEVGGEGQAGQQAEDEHAEGERRRCRARGAGSGPLRAPRDGGCRTATRLLRGRLATGPGLGSGRPRLGRGVTGLRGGHEITVTPATSATTGYFPPRRPHSGPNRSPAAPERRTERVGGRRPDQSGLDEPVVALVDPHARPPRRGGCRPARRRRRPRRATRIWPRSRSAANASRAPAPGPTPLPRDARRTADVAQVAGVADVVHEHRADDLAVALRDPPERRVERRVREARRSSHSSSRRGE